MLLKKPIKTSNNESEPSLHHPMALDAKSDECVD